MTHITEQIMAAVATALGNLATTGANVQRDRMDDVPEEVMAALSLYQGQDQITAYQTGLVLAALTVRVQVHVKGPAPVVSTQLNQVRLEVTQALHGSNNLGLPLVVYDLQEQAASEPDIGGESSGHYTAEQSLSWVVLYQRSEVDPQ